MSEKVDVRLPYSALGSMLRPDIPLTWRNELFALWADKAGYDRGVVFYPTKAATQEIFYTPVEKLAQWTHIKSGNVVFNPYATTAKILTRQRDPIRPKERFGLYHLAFAKVSEAERALHKLEDARQPEPFPIATYPYQAPPGQRNPFGAYQHELLIIHPEAFNDTRNADQLINLVNKWHIYKGLIWDPYQVMGRTDQGTKPIEPWQDSLPKMLAAGVIKEFHVQAGRAVHNDPRIPSFRWLQEMVGIPNYNSELGRMIRMVKDANPKIPFVVEITLDSLAKAGILKKIGLLQPDLPEAQNTHRALIDYIRRV